MKINLASTRMAFFLIAILVFLIILSAVIPQKDISQNQIVDLKESLGDFYSVIETLKLDQIYTSPYFFIVLGLLGINLIFGNFKRIKTLIKSKKILVKVRFFGSIIFHFGLVIIIIGIILNYMYKFEGIIAITEGQAVIDSESIYTRTYNGPFYKDKFERFKITLDNYYQQYPFENTTTEACEIRFQSSPQSIEKEAVLSTNYPLVTRYLEVHYGLQHGYSPEVVLTDTSGQKIFKSFVRLAIHKTRDTTIHADYYQFDEQNLKLTIEVNESEADTILYNVVLEKFDEVIFNDIISSTDTIKTDNYLITIPRVRNWVYLNIVQSSFLTLIFFGFWLTLGGISISFIPRLINEKSQNHDLN